ncbi:DoxX family membrane protein [Candidatus Pacearchaeota archaeon]|nr:DoxX family membrane protein [Candidatus Pacearchaeota archaeon]
MKEKPLNLLNRIVLGLVMLVPGLMKLFVSGASGVSGMLSGIALFSWAPMFWAWVLILAEILFGIAILAKYKLEYTVIPPVIILLVAAFAMSWGSWGSFFLHLAAISNLALLAKWKF